MPPMPPPTMHTVCLGPVIGAALPMVCCLEIDVGGFCLEGMGGV